MAWILILIPFYHISVFASKLFFSMSSFIHSIKCVFVKIYSKTLLSEKYVPCE